ncbi:MAG: 2-hydroxychromene-2-carboxylate isomerase [Microcoleaceae cyanobacterium]
MSKTLDIYYSFSSPFAYLAQSQIPALVERTKCNVNYHLIDLKKLWQRIDNPGPGTIPIKLKYLIKDIEDWRKYYNVPLNIPSRFPIDNRPASAASIVAKKEGKLIDFIEAVMKAYYINDLDISDPEVLGKIAQGIGINSETIITGINDPTILQVIDTEAEAAAKRGVFGVPTFFIGDNMYWGNDRLIFVEAALK